MLSHGDLPLRDDLQARSRISALLGGAILVVVAALLVPFTAILGLTVRHDLPDRIVVHLSAADFAAGNRLSLPLEVELGPPGDEGRVAAYVWPVGVRGERWAGLEVARAGDVGTAASQFMGRRLTDNGSWTCDGVYERVTDFSGPDADGVRTAEFVRRPAPYPPEDED